MEFHILVEFSSSEVCQRGVYLQADVRFFERRFLMLPVFEGLDFENQGGFATISAQVIDNNSVEWGWLSVRCFERFLALKSTLATADSLYSDEFPVREFDDLLFHCLLLG
jgi:hypothetical protein